MDKYDLDLVAVQEVRQSYIYLWKCEC